MILDKPLELQNLLLWKESILVYILNNVVQEKKLNNSFVQMPKLNDLYL